MNAQAGHDAEVGTKGPVNQVINKGQSPSCADYCLPLFTPCGGEGGGGGGEEGKPERFPLPMHILDTV